MVNTLILLYYILQYLQIEIFLSAVQPQAHNVLF